MRSFVPLSDLSMSKPRGKCAFCESSQIPLSKGHIWPECFGEILPSDAKYHEEKIGYFNTFETSIPGPEKFERVGTGPLHKRRPRNTCIKCNGGWMSMLETASLPIVRPLILGEPSLLDTKGMNLLAPMLALISIRVELIAKTMRAVPQDEIKHLMETGRPSANWCIWIARHSGADLKNYAYRYTAMQIESEPTAKFGPDIATRKLRRSWSVNFTRTFFSRRSGPIFKDTKVSALPKSGPPTTCISEQSFCPP
jgi:hypothetical protein